MTGMTVQSTGFTVTVPAGTYFLGDPCYAVPDKDWGDLLASCDFFGQPVGRTPDGMEVLAFGTQYGDGTYCDREGNTYPVDAALIGLVPVNERTVKENGQYGTPSRQVTFTSPTVCSSDNNGLLIFGGTRINTGDEGEDGASYYGGWADDDEEGVA